jgi:hypothetical protein
MSGKTKLWWKLVMTENPSYDFKTVLKKQLNVKSISELDYNNISRILN